MYGRRRVASVTHGRTEPDVDEIVIRRPQARLGYGAADRRRGGILDRHTHGVRIRHSARIRHLDALRRTRSHIETGRDQLEQFNAPEILAEELRLAQKTLGEITGQYLPDDLLGAIFSSFCIGK